MFTDFDSICGKSPAMPTKINLARSRFYHSQTNREAVDRSSSRSAKTGSDVGGKESEAEELLVAYRPDHFVSGRDHMIIR
jgi:hypothetical protein